MIKSKKADIEIQFNWIFILIAGAIILTFFVMLATRQKESAETRANVVVVKALESILTGTKVSTDTATTVTLPVGDIKFDCEGYSVGNVPRKLKQMTVFTPDFIKGKEIVAWAYPWDVPFRVSNFLYITSPQVRYIFVSDNNIDNQNFASSIFHKLPSEIKDKRLSNSPNIGDDKNNYKVRFVYFTNTNPPTFPTLPYPFKTNDKDITAVRIVQDTSTPSNNKVYFYKKDVGGWTQTGSYNYYQNATLFAAIFAENEAMYDCVMKKEFKKLNRVAEVLGKRSQFLSNFYNTPPNQNTECYNYHNTVSNPVSGILDSMKNVQFSSISSLDNWAKTLKQQNKEAEQKSCILIY